jgi:trigger factor
MIEFKIEEVNAYRRHIHFSVEAELVSNSLSEAYDDLKKNARIQGFRKGHVPTRILKKRFWRGVHADVAQKLVQQGYEKVDIKELEVVSQPSIEGQLPELKEGAAFEFIIGVDVRPHVSVDNYKGIEVVYPTAEATEEEVNANIDRQLAGKKRIVEVEDSSATVGDGDYALLALVLTDENGEEVVNEPGTMFHMGNNKFYTGLEKHVAGMKAGESKSEEVTITEDSNFEHLRNKTFNANIELKQIQRMSAPELSDELAVEMGYESVEDMKSKVAADISSSKEENLKNQARVQILQHLVEHNEFEVPQAMVEEQLRALMNELRMQQMYMGRNPDDVQFSDAQIRDLSTRAVFAAKAACLLGSVNDLEGLKVTDEDIEAKLEELAASQGQTVEAIKQYINMEQASDMLSERVQEEKTLNWLLEQAVRLDAPKEAPIEASADESAVEESTESASTAVSMSNSKAELIEVAESLGLSTSGKNKSQLLEAINAAQG